MQTAASCRTGATASWESWGRPSREAALALAIVILAIVTLAIVALAISTCLKTPTPKKSSEEMHKTSAIINYRNVTLATGSQGPVRKSY